MSFLRARACPRFGPPGWLRSPSNRCSQIGTCGAPRKRTCSYQSRTESSNPSQLRASSVEPSIWPNLPCFCAASQHLHIRHRDHIHITQSARSQSTGRPRYLWPRERRDRWGRATLFFSMLVLAFQSWNSHYWNLCLPIVARNPLVQYLLHAWWYFIRRSHSKLVKCAVYLPLDQYFPQRT